MIVRINLSLCCAVICVNLLSFAIGNAYGWSSSVLLQLKSHSHNNPFRHPLTTLQESWIVSLLNLGAAVGPFLGCYCADKIGRKSTLISMSFPMIVSYIITIFASDINLFFLARFLLGLGVGGTFLVLPMYVGEIAQIKNRGFFGCFMAIFLKLGLLYCYILAPYCSVKTTGIACLVPLLLFLILFTVFCPDSPYYYLLNNNDIKAVRSLKALRNCNDNLDEELQGIKLTIYKSRSGMKKSILMIGIGLWFFQQMSGITVILSYMQPIFEASGSRLDSNLSTILTAVIQLMTTGVTAQLIEKLGRKPLLLISTTGSLISLGALGLYFYLKLNELYWLPIVCLMGYIIFYNIGLGPVPWAMMGELFPPNTKALASSICCSLGLFCAYFITMFFPHFNVLFGMAGCFWLFAVFCGLGLVFTATMVPETKGKSLDEIQTIFNK